MSTMEFKRQKFRKMIQIHKQKFMNGNAQKVEDDENPMHENQPTHSTCAFGSSINHLYGYLVSRLARHISTFSIMVVINFAKFYDWQQIFR